MDWCAPAPRSSISMQNLVNLLYRWEQGLRVPDTAADVLLRVIVADPDLVERVVRDMRAAPG